MSPALSILAPGLATTVQDLGRFGAQHLGVPVAGALDSVSLRIANWLVGNPDGTAAVEIAYQGPGFRVEAESVRVALAGGAAPLDVASEDGAALRRIEPFRSVRLLRGQTLRIASPTDSPITYLAIEGGIDLPPVLGSLSTFVNAGIGGLAGRALRQGDRLPLKLADAPWREEQMLPSPGLAPPAHFRVVLGPQADYFTGRGIATFLEASYTVTVATDRMGMRLDGPAIEHAKGYNIVSDGIAPGSIQVPGNGLPIVLLADRQATGGYPKIATVVSADLPALGRLAPGAKLAFEAVDLAGARALRREHEAMLARLRTSIRPVASDQAAPSPERLMNLNLVSGVIDAQGGPPHLGGPAGGERGP